MDIQSTRLELIKLLEDEKRISVLNQIRDFLVARSELSIRKEIESRAEESIRAIENNDVISFDQFTQSNKSWLHDQATK